MRLSLELRLGLVLAGVCIFLPGAAVLFCLADSLPPLSIPKFNFLPLDLTASQDAILLPSWTAGALILLAGAFCLLSLSRQIFQRLLPAIRLLNQEIGGIVREDTPAGTTQEDSLGRLERRIRRLREKVLRTEAVLEESHETLRQTEKLALVGKLAAGVAHSFRNPLTGLKLRTFSLTRGMELTPRQQEDLAAINDAVRHMDAITTNFLEFSRRPHLDIAPVNLSDVVDSTLSLLKPKLESFQVHLQRRSADRMPKVHADAEQLREALANLIINSCEAMGVGGTLNISEEKGYMQPMGSVVVLRIADSGPGIPADMAETVFQPFISTKAEGTGLGLPIARRIFEEHGGWLHLYSVPDRGATFVGVLPACKDDGSLWIRS